MNTSALDSIRQSLAADRQGLRAAVERVPAGMRSRRPAPDRWSVAEILEHLSIVESRVVMLLGPMIQAAPAATQPASGIAPTAIDRQALRNRANRISAPEAIQPTGKVSADEALSALEQSRAELLKVLATAEGRDLSQISRPHPALGTLDGYQWIAAIGGHEERHALQIAEIADTLAVR